MANPPTRPAPDPRWLALAAELGLDPDHVLDGSVHLELLDLDRWAVRTTTYHELPQQRLRELLGDLLPPGMHLTQDTGR